MQELRLVAVSEDGTYLVLATAGRGTRFTLPVDDRLRAAVRGHFSRLGQFEIEVESPLRPKEIQARIRSGETAEEIAESAGIPVERVRWFEGPVLQEREYMAQQAQRVTVRRPGESSPGPPLGETVEERLGRGGVDLDEVEWDAWKCEDNTWRLRLSFFDNGRPHAAEWTFDPRRRYVSPLDEIAARLTAVEWDDDALSDTVTPLVPRRPAMKVVSSDRDPAAGPPAAPREHIAEQGRMPDPRPAFREAAEPPPLREASRPETREPLRPAAETRGAEAARPRDTSHERETAQLREAPAGRRERGPGDTLHDRDTTSSRKMATAQETAQPRDTTDEREAVQAREEAVQAREEAVQAREADAGRDTREHEITPLRETGAGHNARETTHERETAQVREAEAGQDTRETRDTARQHETTQVRETEAEREVGKGGDTARQHETAQVRETEAERDAGETRDTAGERDAASPTDASAVREARDASGERDAGQVSGAGAGREELEVGDAVDGRDDGREAFQERGAVRSRDEAEERDEGREQYVPSDMADVREAVQDGETGGDEVVAEPEAAGAGDAGREREAERFAETPARRAARLREAEREEEDVEAQDESAEDEKPVPERRPAAQRAGQRQSSRTPAKKKPAARPTMPAAGQDKPPAGQDKPAAAAAANGESAAQRPARRRKPKGKRASVPSWDEIMFGARRPE